MAAPDETFTLLPLTIDPSSKAISSPDPTLLAPLTALNTLHRTLLSLPSETHATPPAPLPVPPKRSAQVQKLREGGNASLRKATTTTSTSTSTSTSTPSPSATAALEAQKLYTYALEMALQRPPWEPASLVREELSLLYANRAQAYMSLSRWAEGASDALTSVEMKRTGNGKAWWRRGKCLVEMGRWEEAEGWVLGEGMGVEGNEEELRGLAGEVKGRVREIKAKRGGG